MMLSRPPASHPDIETSRRGMALMLLTHVRNPSKAARALYLQPSLVPHATLSGPTAESIASDLGEEIVDPSYFYTDARWQQHREGLGLPPTIPAAATSESPSFNASPDLFPKGTVGAVCLDARGCIASVTSTGGKTNKLVGRIGERTRRHLVILEP